jgi:hypothetical protein
MRRTWVIVLASSLWLACGGSVQDHFGQTPDGAADRGGTAGGTPADGSIDRGGGAGGGRAGAAGTRDTGNVADATPDGNGRRDVSVADAIGEGGRDVRLADAIGEGDAGAADVSVERDGSNVGDSGSDGDAGCRTADECPRPSGECWRATCVEGGCGAAPVLLGTPVLGQVVGNCKVTVCDGNGGTQDQNDDSDVPDDLNTCTLDGCSNGSPTHVAQTGQMCGTNGLCNSSGQCVGCLAPADCPGTDDFCKTRVCNNGTCGFSFMQQGTLLPDDQQTPRDCSVEACNGSGGIETNPAPGDLPIDSNECTEDRCTGTTPSNPPTAPGSSCSAAGGHVCDGSGACVACVQGTDCGTPPGSPCVVATCDNHQCGTANAPPTTDCGQGPSCNAGAGHLQDKCSGGGACVTGATTSCAPFVCGATACNNSCSDDGGCVTGDVCDTGLGVCILSGTPNCTTDYCNVIQLNCMTTNQQYPSPPECLHTCAAIRTSDPGGMLACRVTHAGLAAGDPLTHCPHAGPAGDGVCGLNCDNFCAIAQTICTGNNQQFTSADDCKAKCAVYPAPSRYTTAVATGDTFACRMYHLTLASVNAASAVTHCPHIAPVSAVCF